MPTPSDAAPSAASSPPTSASSSPEDSLLVRTCRGESDPRTPVWFMRQAGRALPEYRKLREGVSMMEATSRPELITEITLQPVHRYGVDAAILFSDIVVPLHAAGVDLEIVPGVGPVIAAPVRTLADVEALPALDAGQVSFVGEAVGLLRRDLGGVPLIGFAGAPFTLASYLIEGGPSKNHERTKSMMYGAPEVWDALMHRLADLSATFLSVQVAAGASVVQLFDSWVGALPEADYRRYVLPHSRTVLDRIGAETGGRVPRIHFGVGTGELLGAMSEAGADVMGVDFRVPLDVATRRVPGRPLQGNLDPALVMAPWSAIEARVRQTLQAGTAAPGHVFNLGHGVLPGSDPDVLRRIVDVVHNWST